jgi:hypothetical protein
MPASPRLLRACRLDVGQHQIHAFGGGAARQFEADAAGGAGDDRGAVAELLHERVLVG